MFNETSFMYTCTCMGVHDVIHVHICQMFITSVLFIHKEFPIHDTEFDKRG